MENKVRKNLQLTGDGNVPGGFYNNVRTIGDQTINGDLDCSNLRMVGTSEVQGNIKVQKAKVTGTIEVKGNLEAQEFTIVGTVNIENEAAIKIFNINGESKVKGNAAIEQAVILGYLEINGECNTETFSVKGPFKIGDLLNSGIIDIEMHSKCQVKEIGGEKISIRRGKDMLFKKIVKSFYMPKDFYQGHLITESIEGDDIYLEYVKANIVRGNNIEIGPGCEIDLIEYNGNLKIDDSSSVGSKRKEKGVD